MFELHANITMASQRAIPLFSSASLSEAEARATVLKAKCPNLVVLHVPPVSLDLN